MSVAPQAAHHPSAHPFPAAAIVPQPSYPAYPAYPYSDPATFALLAQQTQSATLYGYATQPMPMGLPAVQPAYPYPAPSPVPATTLPSYPLPAPASGVSAESSGGGGEGDAAGGPLPVHGNQSTFNLNPLLHQNILDADYFRALFQLQSYHEVIDEVHARVTHVEPWQAGTSRLASTAFCLLLKFMTQRLTRRQVTGLLETSDQPFVRALGLLYVRYTVNPADMYAWFEPYLECEEEFTPSADETKRSTIGAFCIKLLTELNYFGTTLPRIPVPIERKIKVMLLLLEERKKRRRSNQKLLAKGLFKQGAEVRAIYSDADNEPAWYDAVVDGREEGGEGFWVTFPEYGNSELVDLGDMELRQPPSEADLRSSSRSRSRDRLPRARDRSRSRDRGAGRRDREDDGAPISDLMARVIQSSREASAAVGRHYAHRPVSYKGSLSLKQDRHTVRRRSRSRSPVRDSRRAELREREARRRSRSKSPEGDRSVRVSQEQLERMRRLRERYGDVSASSRPPT